MTPPGIARPMNPLRYNNWFLERLRAVQLWLAAIALIVMIAVTLFDVSLRYFFNSPIRGAYDLVESMLVVFVFNGMSTAFLRRRNIVIDLIDSFAPQNTVSVLIRISDLLAVITLALFAYAMITPAMQAYTYGDRKLELQLPIYILWAVALLGISGAIVCAIGALFAPRAGQHDEPV
jgi:TRAP-type C4-dicarboxylate transport system permease small subunit